MHIERLLAQRVQAWLGQAAGYAGESQAAIAELAEGAVSSSPKGQSPFARLAITFVTGEFNAWLFQASTCSPPSVA
jgi:hypothetical protein